MVSRRGTLSRVIGVIELVRLPLLVLAVVASVALELVSNKFLTLEGDLILVTIIFANIGFNILNDIADIQSDKLLKPWKPLPSGRVSLRTAVYMCLASSLIAFITLTSLKDPVLWLIGLIGVAAGLIYNVLHDRNILGNLALGVAYAVCAYMASYPQHLLFAVGFGILVTGYNVAVEIQDLPGDMRAGWVTLPMTIGIENAEKLSIALAVLGSAMMLCDLGISAIMFAITAALIIVGVITRDYELYLRILGRACIILGFICIALFNIL